MGITQMIREEIKLNLGARTTSIPGFKNVDCDPHPGVHYVGDVSKLHKFADKSVSEIFASNILEHFPHVQTVAVLKEWHRVLKPKGKLWVSVPDFERTVKIYKEHGLKDWIQNIVSGDQNHKTAYHYAIFDFDRLHKVFMLAGFRELSRIDFEHWLSMFPDVNNCSNNIHESDLLPVSINALAIKGEK